VNIIVYGDYVGDPSKSPMHIVGAGCLPGQQYSVNSLADQTGWDGRILGSHDLNGIIAGLIDTTLAKRQ